MNSIFIKAASILALIGGGSGGLRLAPYIPSQKRPLEEFLAQNTSHNMKIHEAVVQLRALPGWSGTGFFIRHNGRTVVVTAAHVCGSEKVLFSSKGIHEVLVVAPERDTCILTAYQGVETVDLSRDPKHGDFISTTGFPLGLLWDYREGTADAIDLAFFTFPETYYKADSRTNMLGEYDISHCPASTVTGATEDGSFVCGIGVTTIRVHMLVRPGNSGGPAMNYWGDVVGIVIASDSLGNGYIVPISEVKQVLARVK